MVECSTADHICLHLSTVDDTERGPAPYSRSVPGLSEALGFGANALSSRFELFSALSDLQTEGLIEERTAVVTDLGEQQRVYTLTSAGEEHARTLESKLRDESITVKTAGDTTQCSLGEAAKRYEQSVAELLTRMQDDILVLDDISEKTRADELPFVDRETEREALQDQFQRVTETPTVTLLCGEPGVGKTMLVENFGHDIAQDGGYFLSGQCRTTGEPYQAIADAFDDLPSVDDDIVYELSGIDQPFEDEEATDIERRRQSLYTRIADRVVPAIRDTPLVLFLDDAQHIRHSTVRLLSHLVEQLSGPEFLAVLASRTHVSTAESDRIHERSVKTLFPETIRVDTTRVAPFSEEATRKLVSRLVGTRRTPQSFTTTVYEQTGGNPLFITESITQMLETGVIKPSVGVYPESTDEIVIPETVEQTITDRLSPLDEDTRELLELASLGSDFVPETVLASAASLEESAFRTRVELFGQSRLWTRENEELSFTSQVIRETIEDTIPEERRESLNRRLADSYRESTTTSEQNAEAMAYHYEQAGDVEAAIDASLTAAERARDVFAHEIAIDAGERALELAKELDETAAIAHALDGLGDTYKTLGEFNDAKRCYSYVRQQTEEDTMIQQIRRKEGEIARRQGAYEQARMHLQESLDRTTGTSSETAATLSELGIVSRKERDFDTAQEYLERAMTLYDDAGDQHGVARCLKNIGIVRSHRGDFQGARTYYERALDSFRDLGDRNQESNCLNNIAVIAWKNGDLETAREYFKQSMELDRELGDRHGQAITRNNLGLLERRDGDLDAAREHLEASLSLKKELGASHGVAITRNNLGIVALKTGNVDEAREYITNSLETFDAVDDREFRAKSIGLLALADRYESDTDTVTHDERLEEALSELRAVGAIPTALELVRHHIEAEHEMKQDDRVRELCQRAQSLIADCDHPLGYEREQIESLCADLDD
jgi:predicted ATPase